MTSGRSWSGRLWGSNASPAGSLQTVSLAAVASGSALAIGILLRLREFLANRSLAQDEAQLALNIIDRPITRLFGQLDFNQAAPPGFLAVQKLVTEALGFGEYSLPALPLRGRNARARLDSLPRASRRQSFCRSASRLFSPPFRYR